MCIASKFNIRPFKTSDKPKKQKQKYFVNQDITMYLGNITRSILKNGDKDITMYLGNINRSILKNRDN